MMAQSPTLLIAFSWTEHMFSLRSLGIALWIGLALLTISLLVLMRTRWGQVKPLSKCVALSIFAHVLLGGYAYGTRLFIESPAILVGESINVTFVETDEFDPNPTPAAESVKDWDRFPGNPDLAESTQELERQTGDEALLVHRATPDIDSQSDQDLSDGSLNEPPLAQPSAALPNSNGQQINSVAQTPSPINKPEPNRQETSDVLASQLSGLKRIDSVDEELPNRQVGHVGDSQDPYDDIDNRLRQLAEPIINQQSDAIKSGPDKFTPVEIVEAMGDRINTDSKIVNSPATNQQAPGDTESDASPKSALASISKDVPTEVRRRLGDGQPVPKVYQLRSIEQRLEIALANGGSLRSERAVDSALGFLAANQSEDGRWDASNFAAGQENLVLGNDRQGAGARADTGITGLTLLAFLGAGHSHLEGDYRENVQKGLEFILRSQADNGNLAGKASLYATMYCHGMASLAISEAYALTGDHRLKPFVERAVAFSIAAQHPTSGGWRYQPGDFGDMSQFGWQVMAIKSARLAGIRIPRSTDLGMHRFLESCSSGDFRGLASYRPQEAVSPTMTAESLICRHFLDQQVNPDQAREATTLLAQNLPSDDRQANLYYWYYATLAMYHTQNEHWPEWNAAIQKQLIDRQQTDGPLAGSWDPDSTWGSYGGRIYSTAIGALSLEVYYRYLPIFKDGQ